MPLTSSQTIRPGSRASLGSCRPLPLKSAKTTPPRRIDGVTSGGSVGLGAGVRSGGSVGLGGTLGVGGGVDDDLHELVGEQGRAAVVRDADGEGRGPQLIDGGRPGEDTRAGVDAGSSGHHTDQAVAQRVGDTAHQIGVEAVRLEGQSLALDHNLRGDGRQERDVVDGLDGDAHRGPRALTLVPSLAVKVKRSVPL